MPEVDSAQSEDLRVYMQKVARRIRANRGREDLSDTQLGVLAELVRDGDRTPTQLAQTERVTPPSMNRTLNGLERAGYVSRNPADDDARKVRVSVTDAGRALMAETRRLREEWFETQLARFTPEERDALYAMIPLLRRIAEG